MTKQNQTSPLTRPFNVSGLRNITDIEYAPVKNHSGLEEAYVICGDASTLDAPPWLRIVKGPDDKYFIGILPYNRDIELPQDEALEALNLSSENFPLNRFDDNKKMFGPFNSEEANGFLFLVDITVRSMQIKRRYHARIDAHPTNPLT